MTWEEFSAYFAAGVFVVALAWPFIAADAWFFEKPRKSRKRRKRGRR